jgi:uncharacterized membrane protein
MTTLASLLRTRTTAVWLVLTLATLLSWSLGGHHTLGMSNSHALAGIAILLIAFVKIRFVGLYFMDLRGAPTVLRIIFEPIAPSYSWRSLRCF